MRAARQTLFMLGVGLAAIGCSEDRAIDHVEFQAITTPPLSVEVTNERITIPDGIAVALTVRAFDEEGSELDYAFIDGRYESPVVEAHRIVDKYDSDAPSMILVYGAGPGEGAVYFGGSWDTATGSDKTFNRIPVLVTVTEQPEP